MAKFFAIHPDNPQARLLRQAVDVIRKGGILVYPTDSGYALGCRLGDKEALLRVRKIKQLGQKHDMTLLCNDLSTLHVYATVIPSVLRLLKAFTPGPYTFILNASSELPFLMLQPDKKTLGLRIPKHNIALSLLECLEAPLMSTSLTLPHTSVPLSEPAAIRDLLGECVDLIIDGGSCCPDPTTIVDLTDKYPVILRQGQGDPEPFK